MGVFEIPAFQIYAFCCFILVLKMYAVSLMTAMTRRDRGTFMNAEDSKLVGDGSPPVSEEHPDVARILRIHRNDFENVFPFLFVGLIYSLSGVSGRSALIVMGTFTVTRVIHTIVYAKGIQPARAILWFIGVACILGMIVSSTIKLL